MLRHAKTSLPVGCLTDHFKIKKNGLSQGTCHDVMQGESKYISAHSLHWDVNEDELVSLTSLLIYPQKMSPRH
jgi:hypothetical protein